MIEIMMRNYLNMIEKHRLYLTVTRADPQLFRKLGGVSAYREKQNCRYRSVEIRIIDCALR